MLQQKLLLAEGCQAFLHHQTSLTPLHPPSARVSYQQIADLTNKAQDSISVCPPTVGTLSSRLLVSSLVPKAKLFGGTKGFHCLPHTNTQRRELIAACSIAP